MTSKRLSSPLLALAVTLVAASGAQAAETAPPAMSAEEQAMMAAMEKAGAPGEQHAWLASMAGSWEFVGTFWMGPGGSSSTSSGTAERSTIHGGRVLVERVKSEFGGQPFEGQGMTGYDNVTKGYWGTWTDNMATGLMTSTMSCNAGKCQGQSTSSDPATGKPSTSRMTSEHSADRETHVMYGVGPDGKEWKMMELVYTRKKK